MRTSSSMYRRRKRLAFLASRLFSLYETVAALTQDGVSTKSARPRARADDRISPCDSSSPPGGSTGECERGTGTCRAESPPSPIAHRDARPSARACSALCSCRLENELKRSLRVRDLVLVEDGVEQAEEAGEAL